MNDAALAQMFWSESVRGNGSSTSAPNRMPAPNLPLNGQDGPLKAGAADPPLGDNAPTASAQKKGQA